MGDAAHIMVRRIALSFIIFLFIKAVSFGSGMPEPLPVDQAFVFTMTATNATTLVAHWKINADCYLYRDRFKFTTTGTNEIKLGKPLLPHGIIKEDDILGKHEIFKKDVSITIPLLSGGKAADLFVTYQGCSTAGFCYPPTTKKVSIDLTNNFNQSTHGKAEMGFTSNAEPILSSQDKVTSLLIHQNIPLVLLSFLGFGLLLTFTPCVLPMIPILSGIILGCEKDITTRKAFLLSLIYVLSMSCTYALAGVAASLLGNTIQAVLQNPWVIAGFSIIFVVLALSLFDVFELRMPAFLHHRVTSLSNRQQAGSYIGVAVMGCLATLIVSPCVTPPLVGALAYIAQTGNAWLGASALFCLGLGMGIPMIIIGTTEGKLLPRAGIWMQTIKSLFGILMLATAIWMLQRILPGSIALLLWSALCFFSAFHLGMFNAKPTDALHRAAKAIGLFIFIYGIILLVGAAMKNTDPLHPLANLRLVDNTIAKPSEFKRIKIIADLQQELNKNKITLLDFYASWCVSCKEMEKHTFTDTQVQQLMKNFNLLQADVTANDVNDIALQKSQQVIAPPSIIFYGKDGKEIPNSRVVGEMKAQEFSAHLQKILRR